MGPPHLAQVALECPEPAAAAVQPAASDVWGEVGEWQSPWDSIEGGGDGNGKRGRWVFSDLADGGGTRIRRPSTRESEVGDVNGEDSPAGISVSVNGDD